MVPCGVGFSTWEVREIISEEDAEILRPSLQRLDGFICWLPCSLPVTPNAGPPFGESLAHRDGSASLLDPRTRCLCHLPLPADSVCFWPLRGNCPTASSPCPRTCLSIGPCDQSTKRITKTNGGVEKDRIEEGWRVHHVATSLHPLWSLSYL